MIRTSFNDDWQTRPKVNPFAELGGLVVPFEPVTLPHDAMIGRRRIDPATDGSAQGAANAYFPGGVVEYRKTFLVPSDQQGRRIVLHFEGVYRDAMVYINGDYAGQRPYGYSQFYLDIDPFLRFGQDNQIQVEARTQEDSRWYTGAGIYRDVWLLVGGPVRIKPEGVRITTPDVDDERAVVEVATTVENDSNAIRTVEVQIELRAADGTVVAADRCPLTVLPRAAATARQRVYVREPALWGPDSPSLYTGAVTLTGADGDLDSDSVTFGIRTLRLDPEHGLRLNGQTIKLRGACIHHDNGVLGAATYPQAEQRRIRILKGAGFNAVRMAHHPMSNAMLDACDRLGMLVMDETFDVWTAAKSGYDYSLNFPEWWERDVEAMVAKDFNHPSVILYSIGNEIAEVGSPAGAARARSLAEKVRSLDGTRYVTNSINSMLAVLSELSALRRQADQGTGINTAMADPGAMMNAIATSELATRRTAEAFGMLDVAGMNYSEDRYALDAELFPNRIIVGAETFPTRIASLWNLVRQHQHVIGDFTWTGWDYLGEAGAGRPQYATEDGARPTFTAPFPYLLAGTGDIDITAHRRPVSYYREIVFGLRSDPFLAVGRPEHYADTYAGSPWAWSDVVASWTWPGYEGAPVRVEVYSDADEVELLVEGTSLGRQAVGPENSYRTAFDAVYQPGRLEVIAYRDGVESGRDHLHSAVGPLQLRGEAEAAGDLVFVTFALTDAAGTVHQGADRAVSLTLSNAVLLGFGSADPATEQRFDATVRHTYEGRALAVIRVTEGAEARLLVSAPDCAPLEITC